MIDPKHLQRNVLLGLALLLALAPFWLSAEEQRPTTGPAEEQAKSEPVTITIFNTGDFHEKTRHMAKIAGFVKEHKKKDPNVLFLDAGDFLDDGNLGDWPIKGTQGEAMMRLMIACGYDVCILGNHDYKVGRLRVLELCNKYPKFPLVLCNMNWSEEDKEKAKIIPRYKIFEFQGVRVAVVGSGSRYKNREHGPPFPWYHEREGYRGVYPKLKEQADIIVFISHRWNGSDRNLLNAWGENSPDVLVGGHSHERLVWRIGRTLVIKAGAVGNHLGMVTLKWDGEKVVSSEGRVLSVGRDWPEDEEVKQIRESYMNPKPKKKEPAEEEKKKEEKAAEPAPEPAAAK